MTHAVHAFQFKESMHLLKPTGYKARNLRELREALAVVSGDSIIHHTVRYLLRGQTIEYTNEFAHWAGQSLEETALAEHLSSIDPYDYPEVEQLRQRLMATIDTYLAEFPEPRNALPGNTFYFSESVTIAFPIGIRARNLAEFLMVLKYVDCGSIDYHFLDARSRLGGRNDFSVWLDESMEKRRLAELISGIDPFMHGTEGIRRRIIEAVEEELRLEMEEPRP